jgi:hypothetical protein
VRPHFLAGIAFLLILAPTPVFACKCVMRPQDTVSRQASWDASRRTGVVFEGKVESADLKWTLLTAPIGEVIPADIEVDEPGMQVSFAVLRAYSDVQQKHLQLRTGLGGGDCGFTFEVGEEYLVDAYKNDSGELTTSICSDTDLLENSQDEVAYLRGEPTIPETVETDSSRKEGQICGHLVADNTIKPEDGQVLLFREVSNSPLPSDEASPGGDGSFCFTRVRPGKYFISFSSGPGESPTAFSLFPGVSKLSEATAIEIKAGQQISHLLFKVIARKPYSVSGRISNFNKAQRQAAPKVFLFGSNRLLFACSYQEEVAPDRTFTFPQVLPGKYWAIVDVDSGGTKWLTKKVSVDVEGNIQDLTLELLAN